MVEFANLEAATFRGTLGHTDHADPFDGNAALPKQSQSQSPQQEWWRRLFVQALDFFGWPEIVHMVKR